MNRVEVNNLIQQDITSGISLRNIKIKYNVSRRYLENFVKNNGLEIKYRKPTYDESFFSKIDTKEKAYILGFLLGDSCLQKDNIEISLSLSDLEVLQFMQHLFGGNIIVTDRVNKESRQFPKCRMSIGNKRLLVDLNRLFGGHKKDDRHIPIISKGLENYLLLGFFDAEGCITWGFRKDRNRLWHKVSFTSSYKMLMGIQSILMKNGISSIIHPKSHEKCFVLEFANKKDIRTFYNLIYKDIVVLKRKKDKFDALRLELGELLETSKEQSAAEPTE